MSSLRQGSVGRYLRFLLWVIGVTIALLLIGYSPTRSQGGETAVVAMWFACGVSLVASAVSGLPIVRARSGGLSAFKLFVASIVLRLFTVAVGGVAVAMGAGLEPKPFLLWLAISYLALLVVDTAYTWTTLRRL